MWWPLAPHKILRSNNKTHSASACKVIYSNLLWFGNPDILTGTDILMTGKHFPLFLYRFWVHLGRNFYFRASSETSNILIKVSDLDLPKDSNSWQSDAHLLSRRLEVDWQKWTEAKQNNSLHAKAWTVIKMRFFNERRLIDCHAQQTINQNSK